MDRTGLRKVPKRIIEIYNDNDMSVYAGNATLFIVTAFFPLMMLIITAINLIPGYSSKELTDFVFQFLPKLDSIKELVESLMNNLQSQSGGLLASAAALTTIWSAGAGIRALQAGLKQITPGAGTKVVHDMLISLAYTIAFVILFPVMLVIQMLGNTIVDLVTDLSTVQKITDFASSMGIDDLTGSVSGLLQIGSMITLAAAVLMILLTYTYLPGGRRKLRTQIPGTVFTALTWFAFTELFAIFIPIFYKSSGIYGSLASLFLAFLWLRLMMMLLFFGGALNCALTEMQTGEIQAADDAGKPDISKATDDTGESDISEATDKDRESGWHDRSEAANGYGETDKLRSADGAGKSGRHESADDASDY